MKEERKVLTQEEKDQLLKKHHACYICLDSLDGYSPEELQYDHIYNYADGYPQELSNFAPVQDRKSVVQGKSVDLGGRRIIKKKKKTKL